MRVTIIKGIIQGQGEDELVLPTDETVRKLESEKNIWIATVRPDGRPHLAPVWFAYYEGRIYISTEEKSIKARNIRSNPNVTLCLEDGTHPVICEGFAEAVALPASDGLKDVFYRKYEWDLSTGQRYSQLYEIRPVRWLTW